MAYARRFRPASVDAAALVLFQANFYKGLFGAQGVTHPPDDMIAPWRRGKCLTSHDYHLPELRYKLSSGRWEYRRGRAHGALREMFPFVDRDVGRRRHPVRAGAADGAGNPGEKTSGSQGSEISPEASADPPDEDKT